MFISQVQRFTGPPPTLSEEGPGRASPNRRSWKRDGYRRADSWRAQLRYTVKLADGSKFLGECTVDDLLWAAAYRREKADAELAKADLYEQLAERLKDSGVETVKDLPYDTGDAE